MSGEMGRRPRRPSRGLIASLAVGAAAVAAGLIVYFVVEGTGGSSRPAATDPVTAAITNHGFVPPECAPLHGRRWVYPGTVRMSSTLYESFAISFPCSAAATWTKRLIRDVVPYSKTGNLIPISGPAGFSCGAWSDATHHAYAGGCQKGPSAFGWNWNVPNPHDYFVPGPSGRMELSKGEGTDAETLLRSLAPNRYQLEVLNTSGIGFITRFLWSPPASWTITRVGRTTGGTCTLASGGLSCTGSVPPPSCLCTGSGGMLAVEFTVSTGAPTAAQGGRRPRGSVGSSFDLQAMTPVPFLVPGTPQAAARQHGI
jgi:hypothetical protein